MNFVGILFIGDPHLSSHVPGFRKDEYPRVILDKLRFALDHARVERLKPVLLGDLFDVPRDSANWLLTQLLNLLSPHAPVLALCGNHDRKENELGENDTLSVMRSAGSLRLLDDGPWTGTMNGRPILIGGTSWGRPLPRQFDPSAFFEGAARGNPAGPLVAWAAHHDMRFAGYEAGRHDLKEIEGVDLVVNGHIHRDLGAVATGRTTWINPGNIARVKRSDASRAHLPGVLRVDVSADGLVPRRVPVPHQPFDAVFHPEAQAPEAPATRSQFVAALAELERTRTASGAGLETFLEANLGQFEADVAAEIRRLASEVMQHE